MGNMYYQKRTKVQKENSKSGSSGSLWLLQPFMCVEQPSIQFFSGISRVFTSTIIFPLSPCSESQWSRKKHQQIFFTVGTTKTTFFRGYFIFSQLLSDIQYQDFNCHTPFLAHTGSQVILRLTYPSHTQAQKNERRHKEKEEET